MVPAQTTILTSSFIAKDEKCTASLDRDQCSDAAIVQACANSCDYCDTTGLVKDLPVAEGIVAPPITPHPQRNSATKEHQQQRLILKKSHSLQLSNLRGKSVRTGNVAKQPRLSSSAN